jgi:hypothetical protein
LGASSIVGRVVVFGIFRSPLLLFRQFIGSLPLVVGLFADSFVGVTLHIVPFLHPVGLSLRVGALVDGPVRMSAFFLFLCCTVTIHVHVSIVVVVMPPQGVR